MWPVYLLVNKLPIKLAVYHPEGKATPYHPARDGFVERFNRTMMEMVSKLIEPDRRQQDWDEKLQIAMFAYRSTQQTSTE